ncbi:MAG: DEAD/DEAH box helicase family protein [Syntrophales bacterium]|jgi:type I restriction enzyme R subunit|nr:DEAD/DEAH box helicase family protein [Syntrophales bacterium]
MAKQRKAPELKFQEHIADFLIREHGYCVLEQTDITDAEHYIAEDQLWAFLKATQADMIKKLADDYGTDARDEVFRALRRELEHTPLWMIFRQGLKVRGLEFHLYYAKPRSLESAAATKHGENRITFRPHFYFGETNQEIDFVLFLNGLPIVAMEVKHEKNQNVHDAVAQFAGRDHARKIFRHPFLYLVADTSDVMAASDPSRVENFRWHNTGLTNAPQTAGEYPVEFLYREVLSKNQILEMLSFFLIRAPEREAEEDKPASSAFTILPRYHQSRMVRKVADDAAAHFAATGDIGRKYLIDHSAGSGKTLSICWLADRLHSLFKPGTNEKLVDAVFILTDRKSLDTNIREDIEKFTHLKAVVGLARKSEDLPRFLKERKPIVVTTQQKFAWVLEEIEKNPDLKELRVAFLIDEAHRSQEGRMGVAIRVPFRKTDDPDVDDATEDDQDEEEKIARIIREHDRNQLFVAFTATPAPSTLTLFGSPFDTYSEAEAIAEGYIVDVATSIISYKTLYHLHCAIVPPPDEERLYPIGVVAKALQNVAYQDDGLIQYKAEIMLRIFEKDVKPLISGRAKAMIVATSRIAGLRYFDIIKEKLKERGADYKALYAFSDFVHPETNAAVSEHAVNGLRDGELIEDRFEGDDYRLMIVANKFQTGFDQPLLAGMFLDKPVVDRNAVQTVSRLNRCHEGKKDVVVVDFTNNAAAILRAFAKYRKGTPFEPDEPDPALCTRLHSEILAAGVFTQQDATDFVKLLAAGTDAQVQYAVHGFRIRFQARLGSLEVRKVFVYLLARLVKSFHFLTCFFTYPDEIRQFAAFAEYVGPQLIKQGSISELMKQIRQTEVIKSAVTYEGEVRSGGKVKLKPGRGGKGPGPPPKKVSVQDIIADIRARFDISDEEALYIRQVTEAKVADPVIRSTVHAHREDSVYLEGAYRGQVNGEIQETYDELGRYEELSDPKYTDPSGIFDIMAFTVIQNHLFVAA